MEAELRRCMTERAPFEMEYRVVWRDGSVHWIADRGIFEYESDGRCTRLLGIIMDITERKQAEETQRESETLFRVMTETSPLAIYASTGFGETAGYINPTFVRLFGYTIEDVPCAAEWWPRAYPEEAYRKQAQEMLFNVIRHAQVREAAVRVRRIGRCVCLSVFDQGRGFDAQELKETSGVGLFSIRERTELLGGRFKVKSATGQGSRFSIIIRDSLKVEDGVGVGPRAYPISPMPDNHEGKEDNHGGLPLRVLLVDDHDMVRKGLAAMLRGALGIELVGETPDGREAIDMAVDLRPDVVIMDVSMPMMKGDEATRRIKAYLPQTRVIALSMYDEAEKKKSMFEAGAEDYILKTISAEDLLAAIRRTV